MSTSIRTSVYLGAMMLILSSEALANKIIGNG